MCLVISVHLARVPAAAPVRGHVVRVPRQRGHERVGLKCRDVGRDARLKLEAVERAGDGEDERRDREQHGEVQAAPFAPLRVMRQPVEEQEGHPRASTRHAAMRQYVDLRACSIGAGISHNTGSDTTRDLTQHGI